MANNVQTPMALVALNLPVVCYVTPPHTYIYIYIYAVTHDPKVQIPTAFLALDLHLA